MNPEPREHVFVVIMYDEMDAHRKQSCHILKYVGWIGKESTGLIELWAELATFSRDIVFIWNCAYLDLVIW